MKKTTFRQACLQDKPFFFYEEGNIEYYRVKNGELEQFSKADGNIWLESFIPCIEWLMETCIRRVEILEKRPYERIKEICAIEKIMEGQDEKTI